jgi:hypothetical protein
MPPCPRNTCCNGDADCSLRCWFKCIGNAADLPDDRCPIPCSLQINIPTPATIDALDGVGCPPPGLGCASHPCNACYAWDNLFFLLQFNANARNFLADGWSVNEDETDLEDCDNGLLVLDGPTLVKCWTRLNAECPDIPTSDEWPIQCDAEIEITSQIRITNTWDGECGEIIVELVLTATQRECLVAIDPITLLPLPNPATTHTYEFSRSWCNCEDLLGALTYDGVNSVNNERGITVADPCTLSSATVSLNGDPYGDCSANCPCWECDDGIAGDFTVNISGTAFTGSFSVGASNDPVTTSCQSYGEFIIDCGSGNVTAEVYLNIDCRECEYYVMRLRILIPGDVDHTWTTDPFQCGDAISFNQPDSYSGCLDDHTITLS